MSEWSSMTLEDIAEFNPRESLKKGEVAVKISMDKLQPFCRDIPEIEFEVFSGGTKFRNRDTIMARITPCLENGKTAMVNVLEDGKVGFGSTEYIVFRAKPGITDPYFLYYLVCSPTVREPAIKSMVGSSGRQRVQTDVIQKLQLAIPSLSEQKKIGNFLKKLDDKIAVNNQINRNLEEQLTAVYNEWFGMYKPYNIGIGGEPNYELDAGWKVADIYSIANIIYGAPFASKMFNTEGDGIPIVRIRDLKNQELVTYTTEKHPKGYLIKHGDIVVGMDGEFRPYIWGNDEAWLNQRVCIFDNIRENGKAFLYCTIKPLLYSVEATELATTVIHIGKKDFDEFRVVLPPEDVLDKFETLSKGMYDKIVECQVENRRLAQLRDTLLPRLMSGELDVADLDI